MMVLLSVSSERLWTEYSQRYYIQTQFITATVCVHVCRASAVNSAVNSEHLLEDIGGDASHKQWTENTHLVPE